MALTTNRGQKDKQEDVFCYWVHPENDYTKTIVIMPEDYVKGWKFEDYLANGFQISHSENDQTAH